MVNISGPVDIVTIDEIKSNNEENTYKNTNNPKEKTRTFNEIVFVQTEKENILIEHSKLKNLKQKQQSEKPPRGRVIFMQHGLDGFATGDEQHIEFQVMAAYLTRKGLTGNNGYGYVSLGIVTKRKKTIDERKERNIPRIEKEGTVLFLNNNQYDGKSYYDNIHTNADGTKSIFGLKQFINTLTLSNNVLIRNEFSKGTLSFSEQLKQYTEIVELFGNFEADVTFIGHSMGGLSSINYAVDYHSETGKDIDVITISTPYDDNIYAKFKDTPAHRELAGVDEVKNEKRFARNKLENKWNTYNNIDLISIGIDGFKNLGDGDDVVSLKSQLNLKDDGSEIYNNSTKIIIKLLDEENKIGYEIKDNSLKQIEMRPNKLIDWHSKTPDLKDVIEITNKFII